MRRTSGTIAAPATKGTELTGYPAISVYEEFRYHPKQVIGGVFDWVYDHLGMFSWVVEIWSPMREAGIKNYKYIDWFRDHPIEDDLKLYRWNVDKLGGIAHIAWKPFDHPQLGPRRDRRLEPLPRVRQSAAGVPRARGRALSEVARLAGADVAEAGARRRRAPSARRRPLAGAARRAEYRVAAELRVEAGAGAQGRPRRDRGDRAAGRRDARRTASAARSWASSKARRTSTPACRSGRITTSPTTARRSNGSCRASKGDEVAAHGAARPRRNRPRAVSLLTNDALKEESMDDSTHEDMGSRRDGAAALLAACATPPTRQAAASTRIQHIVVIYAENRSFDHLYGLFPGANGIANATPEQYTQVDRDGKPLPHLPPVWKGKDAGSGVFQQDLPNKPFRIDAPPINMPLSMPTRDLDPQVLSAAGADQRRAQRPLRRGVRCRRAADGLLRRLDAADVEAGRRNTRSPTTSSWARSATRSSTTSG